MYVVHNWIISSIFMLETLPYWDDALCVYTRSFSSSFSPCSLAIQKKKRSLLLLVNVIHTFCIYIFFSLILHVFDCVCVFFYLYIVLLNADTFYLFSSATYILLACVAMVRFNKPTKWSSLMYYININELLHSSIEMSKTCVLREWQ